MARVLARHGGILVAEDLLPFVVGENGARVFLDGEAVVREWVAGACDALAGHRAAVLELEPLLRCGRGRTAPLHTLAFLDAGRRGGASIDFRPLKPSQGLALLLQSGFTGLETSTDWPALLEICATIVTGAAVAEATVPDGLEALDRAARSYSRNSTS